VEAIINTNAGSVRDNEIDEFLRELFASHEIPLVIHRVRSGKGLVELARDAASGPEEVIIAGGGDGTVSTVASELAGTGKTLGILPLGTLNHFAKDLGLPLDLEQAVLTIIEGHTTQVDVGEVNGLRFINNSSIGLYPSLVKERSRVQRLGYGKWPAFLWAAISVFKRYPTVNIRLNAGGEELAHKTPFVFIGNNEYQMEGFRIGGRARLDEGMLSVYLTRETGRWGLIRLGLRALFGRLRNAEDFFAFQSKHVLIETRRRRLRIARDGETSRMETPLEYRSLAGALRVIVRKKGEEEAESLN
jgi:diacylglycerol kinase family enzyme